MKDNPHAKQGETWLLSANNRQNAWMRAEAHVFRSLTPETYADRIAAHTDVIDADIHALKMSTMPRQLRAIVAQCLHRKPDLRPTMQELQDTIARILDGDGPVALGPERTDPSSPRLVEPAAAGEGLHLPYTPARVNIMDGHSPTRTDEMVFSSYVNGFNERQTVADACWVARGIYRTARQRTDIEAAMWAIGRSSGHPDDIELDPISRTAAGKMLLETHGGP